MRVDSINYLLLKITMIFLVFQLDFISDSVSLFFSSLFYLSGLGFVFISMKRVNVSVLNQSAVYLLLLWSLFYFFSAILSNDVIHGFKIFVNTSLLYLLFFIALLKLPLTKLEMAFDFLMSTIGVVVVGGTFIFFISGDSFISIIANAEFQETRQKLIIGFSGVFYNQNALGPILALFSSWMLHKILNFHLGSRFVFFILFLVSTFFLFITVSRASILMFVCFSFIYLLLNGNIKHAFGLFMAILLVVSAFIYYFSEVYEFLMFRIEAGGTSHRENVWADALGKWLDVPFFGLGPNQYSYLFRDKVLSTHNYYIAALVNTGIFTFLAFVLFLLLILIKNIKAIFSGEHENRSLMVYSFSLLFSLSIHQLFEASGFSIGGVTGFAALLLIALVCNNKKQFKTFE